MDRRCRRIGPAREELDGKKRQESFSDISFSSVLGRGSDRWRHGPSRSVGGCRGRVPRQRKRRLVSPQVRIIELDGRGWRSASDLYDALLSAGGLVPGLRFVLRGDWCLYDREASR